METYISVRIGDKLVGPPRREIILGAYEEKKVMPMLFRIETFLMHSKSRMVASN